MNAAWRSRLHHSPLHKCRTHPASQTAALLALVWRSAAPVRGSGGRAYVSSSSDAEFADWLERNPLPRAGAGAGAARRGAAGDQLPSSAQLATLPLGQDAPAQEEGAIEAAAAANTPPEKTVRFAWHDTRRIVLQCAQARGSGGGSSVVWEWDLALRGFRGTSEGKLLCTLQPPSVLLPLPHKAPRGGSAASAAEGFSGLQHYLTWLEGVFVVPGSSTWLTGSPSSATGTTSSPASNETVWSLDSNLEHAAAVGGNSVGTDISPGISTGAHLFVLLSADSAALGLWRDGSWLRHKVLTGYTVRRKRGGAQLEYERRGGGAHSVGGSLRAREARRLFGSAAALLQEWAPDIAACRRLYASGGVRAWNELYASSGRGGGGGGSGGRSLVDRGDARWSPLGIAVRRPRFADLQRAAHTVSHGTLQTWDPGTERCFLEW